MVERRSSEVLSTYSQIPLDGPTRLCRRPGKTPVSDEVRGLCLIGSGPVGSGRVCVEEFCTLLTDDGPVDHA